MDKKEVLERLGLNNKEIKLYLRLLENSSLTAHNLAKKTNILRQTVYDTLDKLIKKGLVSYVIRSGVKYFKASSPEKLEEMIEEKQRILKNIMPELLTIQNINKIKPKIEVYEGIEGLKSIYNDIIKSKPKEVLEYGNSQNFLKIMKFYFIENYIKKRVNSKIKLRLITENEPKIKKLYSSNKKYLRKTRTLNFIKKIKTAGYIYNNKIIMISLVKNPIGVIIENKEFAETQKVFFEMMWKLSK